MKSFVKKHALVLVALGAGVAFGVVLFPQDKILSELRSVAFEEGTVLFVGDIMLGRSVERYMEQEGMQYPFEGVSDLLFNNDVTVGNFEGSVPEIHVPTPNFSFTFSIREAYLGVLKEHGFDALSLANNHALDYGEIGYAHTRSTCAEVLISCFGHPSRISEPSTTILEAGDTRVGLLGIHTLFIAPDREAIDAAFRTLEAESDVQIAYIHWGDEYEPFHNAAQEQLAHTLIDQGFDAVIGHHPHVVQDIEMYEGKPIFYSLGNFIFDQYWSIETQEGLALRLRMEKEHIEYELIPITSIGTHSQPHLVEGEAARAISEALLERSFGVTEYQEGVLLRIPR